MSGRPSIGAPGLWIGRDGWTAKVSYTGTKDGKVLFECYAPGSTAALPDLVFAYPKVRLTLEEDAGFYCIQAFYDCRVAAERNALAAALPEDE